MRLVRILVLVGGGLSSGSAPLIAQQSGAQQSGVQRSGERQSGAPPSIVALKKLSLEELSRVEVTSVSRTEQTLSRAAAAIAVVSNEDIRRSGATTITEALRHVPGLHVGRQSSSIWAVSARGFSSVNSEKLLVLNDTRSVYTPLFSGVFWDVQDYVLQDIERIEVVRGPGAALWGSNAVNGVISITTKSARDTQGAYFDTRVGTEERFAMVGRYGGRMSDRAHYRVFAKFADRDDSFRAPGTSEDDWDLGRFGFRTDWDSAPGNAFTLQGDIYSGNVGQIVPGLSLAGRVGPSGDLNVDVAGGNVLGRWNRALASGSNLQVRAYYDRTHRNDPTYVDDLHTADLDLQHRTPLGRLAGHELIWGANYRFTSSRTEGKGIFFPFALPQDSRDQVISSFVQDQIDVTRSLQVTLGTKLEHNDFSGFEVQPSVRAAWMASPDHTVWGGVSRAVRVPTRYERDVFVEATAPGANPIIRLIGNDRFDSERMLAYEAGYRWRPLPEVFLDLATFYNRYRGLASVEVGTFSTDPSTGAVVIPVQQQNLTDGHAAGGEALVTITPQPWWRVSASYSTVTLDLDPRGQDVNQGHLLEGATPRHQVGIRSYLDLGSGVQFDALFRSQSEIMSLPGATAPVAVPGYADLNVRLAWQGWQAVELSLAAQNLLHDHHFEFGVPGIGGEVERSVYGRIAWGF